MAVDGEWVWVGSEGAFLYLIKKQKGGKCFTLLKMVSQEILSIPF